MPVYCRRCGFKNIPDDAAECPKCGAPVIQPVKPDPRPKSFTPKHNPNVIPPSAQKSKAPIIILIVCVLAVGLFTGLFLGNKLSGKDKKQDIVQQETVVESTQNNNSQAAENVTAAVQEEQTQSDSTIMEFGTGTAIVEEEPVETAEPTPEPTPTPVTERAGTVYIAANASPNRIKIRKSPGLDGEDTGKRLYNGDKVTVYEETKKDGYTWYRIGKNKWMADNGKSFGVKFN